MKNKKKTLWYDLQTPEPIVYDERLEAIESRSRIYRVLIIIILLAWFLSFRIENTDNNYVIQFIIGIGAYISMGLTLYKCYFGTLEINHEKRNGMSIVLSSCLYASIYSLLYVLPYRNYASIVWYFIAFIAGGLFFYSLCHITYAQYLKMAEEDFEEHKKSKHRIIGIICAVLLGIFIMGAFANMVIGDGKIALSLSKEEKETLDQIQKAKDGFYNLDAYKLEYFYNSTGEDVNPTYNNYQLNHSYYWQGSEDLFVLVLNDTDIKNPVYQLEYRKNYKKNMD